MKTPQPKPTLKEISERAARERLHGRSITILAPEKPKPTGEHSEVCNSGFPDYDCPICGSSLPKPYALGECDSEGRVFAYFESEDFKGLADARNAALAALEGKIQRRDLLLRTWQDNYQDLLQQLTVELEKREAAEQRAANYHRQLLDENEMTKQMLAAERENTKQLADALKDIRVGAPDIVKQQIKDALAKVGK